MDSFRDWNIFLCEQVEISTPDERVYPNDIIDISIKSNHDSYVGILGVDQRILIEKSKSGDDVNDSVFEKVKEHSKDVFFMTYPGNS